MRRTTMMTLGWTLLATAAFAHAGVKDPNVMAWMAGMKDLGSASKTLVQMARGQVAYDEAAATAALDTLASEAAEIVPLFEQQAEDPKSESLPAIWTDFADFSDKAAALQAAISAADVSTEAGVQAAARSIGATCAACHKAYRK